MKRTTKFATTTTIAAALLAIGGCGSNASESPAPQAVSNGSALKAAGLLASSGLRTKQAAEILAAATGLSRNEAYEMVLAAGADQAKE